MECSCEEDKEFEQKDTKSLESKIKKEMKKAKKEQYPLQIYIDDIRKFTFSPINPSGKKIRVVKFKT